MCCLSKTVSACDPGNSLKATVAQKHRVFGALIRTLFWCKKAECVLNLNLRLGRRTGARPRPQCALNMIDNATICLPYTESIVSGYVLWVLQKQPGKELNPSRRACFLPFPQIDMYNNLFLGGYCGHVVQIYVPEGERKALNVALHDRSHAHQGPACVEASAAIKSVSLSLTWSSSSDALHMHSLLCGRWSNDPTHDRGTLPLVFWGPCWLSLAGETASF